MFAKNQSSHEALSKSWLRYFEANAARVLDLGADDATLSDEERRRITASIQKFQIGEASEGRHLKKQAARFAEKTGDAAYAQSIGFLIREENRHSAYLGSFMRDHGIPRARSTWTDVVFRSLRKLAGLEISIRVLVTAEIIALSYYRCLGGATGSTKLARICERMCEEERAHVRFQMATICRLNLARHPMFSAWADMAHMALLLATSAVVWVEHRPVLRTRMTFKGFVAATWEIFLAALDDGETAANGGVARDVVIRGLV